MKRTPQIPSLADIGQRRSADEIATVIREGRGRMPGFPALPPPALAALVTFLRTGESDRAGHDTSAIALNVPLHRPVVVSSSWSRRAAAARVQTRRLSPVGSTSRMLYHRGDTVTDRTPDLQRRTRQTRGTGFVSASSAISALIVVVVGSYSVSAQRRDYPTRPPADAAAIERGKALYGVNCQFCHGADTRGGDSGPSLLRSAIVLDDQHGELITPVVRGRTSAACRNSRFTDEQIARRRGVRPHLPRRRLRRVAGQAAEHHRRRREGGRGVLQREVRARAIRPAGDLNGLATKIPDPRLLQQTWLMPGSGGGRGGPPPVQVKPTTATVTLPSGEKIDGRLDRIDDFIVALTLGRWHAAVVHDQRQHAEGRDPRSAAAAQGSAARVFRCGHPQRNRVSGDLEMKHIDGIGSWNTKRAKRATIFLIFAGFAAFAFPAVIAQSGGGSIRHAAETARRFVALVLRRLHRPALQRADPGESVERETADAGFRGEGDRRPRAGRRPRRPQSRTAADLHRRRRRRRASRSAARRRSRARCSR